MPVSAIEHPNAQLTGVTQSGISKAYVLLTARSKITHYLYLPTIFDFGFQTLDCSFTSFPLSTLCILPTIPAAMDRVKWEKHQRDLIIEYAQAMYGAQSTFIHGWSVVTSKNKQGHYTAHAIVYKRPESFRRIKILQSGMSTADPKAALVSLLNELRSSLGELLFQSYSDEFTSKLQQNCREEFSLLIA